MEKGEWTILALKEHFEKILEEKDRAINTALTAAKEAVIVAENNAEKWRNQANEWRSAMNDRERTFVTRRELWAITVAIIGFVIGILAIFYKR